PPAVAHESALPCRSVIVTIVLLNEACTWATASVTTRLTFFLTLPAAGLLMAPVFPQSYGGHPDRYASLPAGLENDGFAYFLIARRGPLRVRALVRVRWPRSGRPRR